MRSLLLAVLAVFCISGSIVAQEATKSALERDPKGWINLLSDKSLKNWKRLPLAPDTTVSGKNPWKVEGDLLLCDGVDVKEMLLYDEEVRNGIFHLEWRFRKAEGKPEYNSGAYVRTTGDGKYWHQIQIAYPTMPPRFGDLFGDLPVNGKPERVIIGGNAHNRARPAGEWNTYEITMKGKSISVWINGSESITWNDCPFDKGYYGLQAELYFLEFRNLQFKQTP